MPAVGAEHEVEKLVDWARSAARTDSPRALREAYEQVLQALDVEPGKLSAWRDGLDIIGTAYERLLPGEERRLAGQFFTPFWAGELMAGWLFAEPAKLLLDAGCGSGGLLIPAARHQLRRRCKVVGIDSDPLAITMAATNRRLRRMPRIDLVCGDFLTQDAGLRPDRVISNPPYGRATAISAFTRRRIHAELANSLGHRFSSRLSLQALFLLRALEISSDDARIAFITPSNWLDVDAAAEVKACLLERADIEALVFFDADHLFFDGPLTTALITLVQKGGGSSPTRIVRVGKELPPTESVLRALRDAGDGIETVHLEPTTKWSRPRPKRRTGLALADVARVRRGVATGANDFFCLTEEERVRRGIAPSELRPCIGSPRHFRGTALTHDVLEGMPSSVRRWLVDVDDASVERAPTPLGTYLRRGRRLKVHKRCLPTKRALWHWQEQRGEAEILFTYFNRNHPRFVRNLAGAVPLNNWLVIEPNDGIDPDRLFEELSTRRVQSQLREHARLYGGGLWKLEPSELKRIVLPRSILSG